MKKNRLRNGLRKSVLAMAVVTGLTLSTGISCVYAQATDISIATQPLSAALNELAHQTNTQVTVAPELVAGKIAPAVRGKLSATEALDRLLQGSGLRAHTEATGRVVIVKAAPAPAAQANAPQQLAEVVVKGEKIERSLRQTSASVQVFDSTALIENPSLSSTNSLLEGIPNIASTGTGNLAPTVRGVDGTGPAQGRDAFFAGTRARLGLQIDGRAASYNEVVFGDFSTWDVQQVEVFRGAQSLLQGRNSIAGTVVVKSNDPSFAREVGSRLMIGNYGQREYAAILNTALLEDEVALRIAMDRQLHDSFIHGLQAYPGVGDPGEFESNTLRAKLLVKPKSLPDFSNLLTFSHTDSRGPQTEHVKRPFDEKDAAYPQMNTFAPRTNSGTMDTTWRLSDRITLENRLTYGDFHIARTALPGEGIAKIDGKDFSWEPRVRINGKNTSGFVGAYLFRTKQDETIDLGNGDFEDKATTIATYGEATHALRSDLHLTLGARYEEEHRRRTGSLAVWEADLDETYRAFLPKAVLAWEATKGLTLGAGVSRGYNGGGAGVTYEPPLVIYDFDPEYVWTYEGFTRADFLGGRLSLTGNVFYSDYKDMQLPFDLNPSPTVYSYIIRNADRAETYGAEIGMKWLPIPSLQLNADIGLLKTRIKEIDDPELEGNELARAPAFTANFGAQYRHANGFEAGINARYSESYYSDMLNFSRGRTDPYWIVNTRVAYNFREYRFFAFVNNAFDEDTPTLIQADPASTSATDTALLPQPRMVGVGVEAWF